MRLKVTYLPGEDKIRADVTISPETSVEEDAPIWGKWSRPRTERTKANTSCELSACLPRIASVRAAEWAQVCMNPS
jgi:hypothetical protein